MFGQRTLLRRLAARMLLMWLLALTTGLVNACVIEPEQHHAALSTSYQHPSTHADHPVCAKFCADGSVSARVLKQQSDKQTPVWLAPPQTVHLAVRAALEPVRAQNAERAPEPARVPISIAFLRLTL